MRTNHPATAEVTNLERVDAPDGRHLNNETSPQQPTPTTSLTWC